jgi:G:T/U-mismatch repair DNA glycosylase
MLHSMAVDSWDVFLSHASEDLEAVARPLAEMLERRGLHVWIDELELVPGRGLVEQINNALAASRNGAIILSPSFLRKSWTTLELDALVAGRMSRQKLLIPVWHEIDATEVSNRSPLLAGLFAVRTADGLVRVADQIVRCLYPPVPVDSPSLQERRAFANEFVNCLRARSFTGRTFEASIGRQTMHEIRSLLRESDTAELLDLLKLSTMDAEIRNRAASVLFGPRLANAPSEFQRVASEMRAFYYANVTTGDWRVLRAVAGALADQAHETEPILDWIDRLRRDYGLAEANLRMSDRYNHDKRQAVNRYAERLRTRATGEPWGRLWEVFYLGRRAARGDQDVIEALETCIRNAVSPELGELCNESLGLLRLERKTS